jgi:hypothetical protein
MATQTDVNFPAPVKSVSIQNMVRMREAVRERIARAVELLDEAAGMAPEAMCEALDAYGRLDAEDTESPEWDALLEAGKRARRILREAGGRA